MTKSRSWALLTWRAATDLVRGRCIAEGGKMGRETEMAAATTSMRTTASLITAVRQVDMAVVTIVV